MRKILILFAHPVEHKSHVNKSLINAVKDLPYVTVNNLYEQYPDFFIDVKREQQLLLEHDIVIWQHPFYWYSAPAIIKEWFDLVLEHGFAYGQDGDALKGKWAMSCITTGGRAETYKKGGVNQYPIQLFLLPFYQATNLCTMNYLSPFVVHGVHLLTEGDINSYVDLYRRLLVYLKDGDLKKMKFNETTYINKVLY